MLDAADHKDDYHIQAATASADERTRVLKQGETFAVFDSRGDILPLGRGEQGLYHEGTRFLSYLDFLVENQRPLLLSSTVNERNELLTVDLTNPDLIIAGDREIPRGSLHIFRSKFLWKNTCFERIRLANFGLGPLSLSFSLQFDGDFRDIFEVRGVQRKRRGQRKEGDVRGNEVVLPYQGLDGRERRTVLRFSPSPEHISPSEAVFSLQLEPQESASFYLTICCQIQEDRPEHPDYEESFTASLKRLELYRSELCEVKTSTGQFNGWLNRSMDDLHMLFTETGQGVYPYAGVPWYSTAFGRDGIITALQMLWINPRIARGVLNFLAANQATEEIPESDAEPGKIIHETRLGEMAALGEIPFGRYYGSVDSTPLFVMLAGAYYERTADRNFIESLWPHILQALHWIDTYGDKDGDGFVEYLRHSSTGLVQQGWKDSWDSVFHEDGTMAKGPIALCEVQGYVYAAKRQAAAMAEMLGEKDQATILHQQAATLRDKFQKVFWCSDLNSYALALDGAKRPCRIPSSNAGQCLFTGIASPEQAARLARQLLSPALFSGWGIRTIAEGTARYNPMAYHNGSIWPHDNSLIAQGLALYGETRKALQVFEGMYHLANNVDLMRLPELFCGFKRLPAQGPVLYPLACSPQAWAAGTVFLLLQACLGLTIDARTSQIRFWHPVLPPFLDEVVIRNLKIREASVDLSITRHPTDVGINVLQRDPGIEVVAIK
ncbi:MAG: amylo-alpha-1,6-glucosidase [Syntrophotaleaceae bacterium]